jgi:hypothetical protein
LQNCFVGIEKKYCVSTLVLTFLGVLIFSIIITPLAKADSPSMWLEPSQGPAGGTVMVYIRGLPGPLDVTFGTIDIGAANTWPGTTSANRLITVPQVPPGSYIITASCYSGVATATFTVTQGPSPTPTETSDGTPVESDPTNPPLTTNTGFWSPIAIAVTSAVIAGVIFATTLYVKRGRQRTPQYQETSHYEPRLTVPSKKPSASSKINQPTNSGQQLPFTKICRHCKQAVRDDLNVCPYCLKRLR